MPFFHHIVCCLLPSKKIKPSPVSPSRSKGGIRKHSVYRQQAGSRQAGKGKGKGRAGGAAGIYMVKKEKGGRWQVGRQKSRNKCVW